MHAPPSPNAPLHGAPPKPAHMQDTPSHQRDRERHTRARETTSPRINISVCLPCSPLPSLLLSRLETPSPTNKHKCLPSSLLSLSSRTTWSAGPSAGRSAPSCSAPPRPPAAPSAPRTPGCLGVMMKYVCVYYMSGGSRPMVKYRQDGRTYIRPSSGTVSYL